jgi:hypothetical protein|tara:strand:- start:363 stop:581 length:219 start_codon:yes stop_codon:yes gene_type:complete
MELKDIIYALEKEKPNNMELGSAVRSLVWKMKETQSKEIAKDQLPGQLDMFPEQSIELNDDHIDTIATRSED